MMSGIVDELEGMWKEVAMAERRYYPGIYLEGIVSSNIHRRWEGSNRE
jgi:hypothetical protein